MNDYYFSDPQRWFEDEEKKKESGKFEASGPIDIYWIDDNDSRGPVRLSRPIKCF